MTSPLDAQHTPSPSSLSPRKEGDKEEKEMRLEKKIRAGANVKDLLKTEGIAQKAKDVISQLNSLEDCASGNACGGGKHDAASSDDDDDDDDDIFLSANTNHLSPARRSVITKSYGQGGLNNHDSNPTTETNNGVTFAYEQSTTNNSEYSSLSMEPLKKQQQQQQQIDPVSNGDNSIRRSRSLPTSPPEKKLDEYGFIRNMDQNGRIYEDNTTDGDSRDDEEDDALTALPSMKQRQRKEKKWSTILHSWEKNQKSLFKHHQPTPPKTTRRSRRKKKRRLLKHLRKGIPHSLRGQVWNLLLGVQRTMALPENVRVPYDVYVRKSIDSYNESTFLESTQKEEEKDNETSGSQVNGSHQQSKAKHITHKARENMKSMRLVASKSFRITQETIERDIHRTYPRHSMFHDNDEDSVYDDASSAGGSSNGGDSQHELPNLTNDDVQNIIHHLEDSPAAVAAAASTSPPRHHHHPDQFPGDLESAEGGQAALRRVLRAYSVYDRDVGYCQGMNFIAGMFLTFMKEEEAFWLLVAVMNDDPCRMRGLFGEGMRETHQVLYIAERLTKKFLPKLAKHLDKENIHVTMYATQWLLTLYTSTFSFDLVTRVWDCFLAEGWKVVYRVMLALLQESQSKLLTMTFEDILGYFRELPRHTDGNHIMGVALKIPLRHKHLVKYEAEYKARQEAQQQQQS